MPPLDEFGLIRVWTAGRQSKDRLEAAGVTLGIGDDAAVVTGMGTDREMLLTMDTMVEEIHFREDTMADSDVGYKALAANVSDIAAMGGTPQLALVSVSVPPSWDAGRMQRLYDGLYACADKYGVSVVGGDTTSAPRHLVVAITLIGSTERGQAVKRSGAKEGHLVFLTGPTGLSAGGLHALQNRTAAASDSPQKLIQAHQRPVPSVKAGRLLSEHGWGAALNDVSDGLASEAWELAEASGARLVLEEDQLPISGELASYAREQGMSALDWVLYGGEDYVLLGTAERRHEAAMRERFRAEGVPLFFIGEVEAGEPAVVLAGSGNRREPLPKRGYNHFPKGP